MPNGRIDVSDYSVYPYQKGMPILGTAAEQQGNPDDTYHFIPANELGRQALGTVSTHAKMSGLMDALEKQWGYYVGDPSPDITATTLHLGIETKDKLDGRAIMSRDVICWDLNLGALITEYESRGWSAWRLWTPPTALGRLLARQFPGEYGDAIEAFNALIKTWNKLLEENLQ